MYEALVARVRYHIQKANFMGLKEAESTLLLAEAADAIGDLQKAVNFHKFNSEFWEDKYNSLADEKWIPVTEALPKHAYGEGASVLTVSSLGSMRVLYFDGGNWCYPTGEALTTARKYPITHWMPLPEPPKEEA